MITEEERTTIYGNYLACREGGDAVLVDDAGNQLMDDNGFFLTAPALITTLKCGEDIECDSTMICEGA